MFTPNAVCCGRQCIVPTFCLFCCFFRYCMFVCLFVCLFVFSERTLSPNMHTLWGREAGYGRREILLLTFVLETRFFINVSYIRETHGYVLNTVYYFFLMTLIINTSVTRTGNTTALVVLQYDKATDSSLF